MERIDVYYPTTSCPKCGHEEEDMDGFGFLGPCPSCGYCTHPNSTMEGDKWICGVCGGEVKYDHQ